jgi:hypothetical protein
VPKRIGHTVEASDKPYHLVGTDVLNDVHQPTSSIVWHDSGVDE